MTKRLFLFAAYDRNGVIDASLIYYVRALSAFGDVIFIMGNDVSDDQLQKLSPYVIHAAALRHDEYDFGSYKRAYIYARDMGILKNYDFMYMVNDSVYGPLMPMGGTLERAEALNTDAFGIVAKRHRERPHIQSWFIGCRPTIFNAKWFNTFITSVKKQESKGLITRLYEHGFTQQTMAHNLSWDALYYVKNRGVYNKIKKLYQAGMPFMKKLAFTRHRGALGAQIAYILRNISPAARNAILENARRIYGDEYIRHLLTRNPIKIIYRNITNAIHKIFTEGI